ncbi:hypothetical protein R5R35_008994 [Gryllus longicercus]|uniref:TOM1-like protein 2 n=1 Tax=Gryllus longicercus TaxID=2509291 RepID=A0AAN9VEY0_9ORTH
MSFFVGNPFASPVGQRIEQATDVSLPSENWALNMEICDIINSTEDGAKDAIKAIRKRLQQNAGKNYTVVMYTLTVLETCVKNCGRKFHVLACNKEFIQELVKLIGPKNDPPTAVQEKVLSLIQSWADAFRNDSELAGVVQMYTDLKQKGIEFPMTDLDSVAPIHTPQRSVRSVEPPVKTPVSPSMGVPVSGLRTPSPVHAVRPEPRSPQQAAGAVALSPEQLAKLQSELDVVQGNMLVLSEMLSELTPGKEHPSDMQLLQELHETCQAMKHRLVELIGKINNDEITAELLRINDELNNVFLRYSRFENNRSQPVPAAVAPESIDLLSGSPAFQELSLLDTSPTLEATKLPPLTEKPIAAKIDKEDEFDMFAQSRNTGYDTSKKDRSLLQDALEPEQVNGSLGAVAENTRQPVAAPPVLSGTEREFDEMAAWLDDKPGAVQSEGTGGVTEESLTSGEFERFLAERAAAAEALPNIDSTRPGSTATTRSHHPRQLNKEADSESSLFAL